MTTARELQERFHLCMPLFIALGDEMRLSIVEVLTEEAMGPERPTGPVIFEDHALNVNEITQPVSYTHLQSPISFSPGPKLLHILPGRPS